ncbi:MAG TPA: 4-(cytidine 5'-diphospho)-2-C-methyl-D-erythritol kinase [Ramlibacter sp.]|nr:4-(cytidine 5'-diphospho)-2-C-methyl-D-erythritol kinase [Ramlibacter sp.]
MKALYDVPAPAKLNLFLHVTGRRPDGLHLLQSVFMLIDWCDTLHFELRPDGGISRQDLGEPLPAEDLVVRAARNLQAASGTTRGAHIAIDKKVPAQAGLGGGSSDAATCLLALNRLWGLNLPVEQLARIGLALGADVPFFLGGRNAWVEGVGEQLRPVELPPGRFAVVKPPQGLSTALVFSQARLRTGTDAAIISGFAASPGEAEMDFRGDPFGFGRNDLQPAAQGLCPGVTEALEWLGSQGLAGRMTGSGSAVFSQMPQDKALQAAPAGWQARECGNLEAHPLVGWAPSDDSSVGG